MADDKEKKPIVSNKDEDDDGTGDYVKVSRKDLSNLMDRLDKQNKDITLLYKASDQNRLSRAMGETEDSLIKKVKVSVWQDNGQHVIGWKMIKNQSEIVAGRWVEDQTVEIFFEEAKPVTVTLLEFYRKIFQKDLAEILERTQKIEKIHGRSEEYELFTVQFEDGKTLKINSKYVN